MAPGFYLVFYPQRCYIMVMITIIIMAAVINALLGVIALSRGKSRVNYSFAAMSLLFAFWNGLVAMWQGYGFEPLARVNFAVISLIPPAALFFVVSLFGMKGRSERPLLGLFGVASAVYFLYGVSTFFYAPSLSVYDTPAIKLALFIYQFASTLIALVFLVYRYAQIKYKQEKTKIGYVIGAFAVLFCGGMLELYGSLKMNDFKNAGNVASMLYGLIIFFAIFRLRLFDTGIIVKNFFAYTVMAAAAGGLYLAAALFFDHEKKMLYAAFFVISAVIVFFARTFHGVLLLFADRIGGRNHAQEAEGKIAEIDASQAPYDEKITGVLQALGSALSAECAVFTASGSYYIRKWQTPGALFPDVCAAKPDNAGLLLRYENSGSRDILDCARADFVAPFRDSSGFLAGKKQVSDISFMNEEAQLLEKAALIISLYEKNQALKMRAVQEENLRQMGQMASQMAHEIKNPLTALWGATQLLSPASPGDAENIGIIKREIKRLTGILDTWRDFSAEIKLEKAACDLKALLEVTVKMARMQFPEAEFNLDSPEARVVVDADRLKQVFLNLLINAGQAVAGIKGARVDVALKALAGGVEVRIRDNGTGMSAEVLQKARRPMFTTKPGGSGLGLAVCERIVAAHNGSMLLLSDGQTYTEIIIILPGEA